MAASDGAELVSDKRKLKFELKGFMVLCLVQRNRFFACLEPLDSYLGLQTSILSIAKGVAIRPQGISINWHINSV